MFDINESRRICRAAIDYPEPIQDGAEFWHEGQYSGGPSQWAWFDRIEQANLYAHARTALPAALDEIERLREVIRNYARKHMDAEMLEARNA